MLNEYILEIVYIIYYLFDNILQYLEEMEFKYHDKAKAANVYVVGSCGGDSIPADIGIKFTRDSFSGMKNNNLNRYCNFNFQYIIYPIPYTLINIVNYT